jgi:hypothetical protein
MSNLISGKEALIALANGEDVEFFYRDVWDSIGEMIVIDHFMSDKFKFRIKPRTITLNGVELNKCYSLGIDRIKNEVSIQFKDESDADRLHDLLAGLYGFKG